MGVWVVLQFWEWKLLFPWHLDSPGKELKEPGVFSDVEGSEVLCIPPTASCRSFIVVVCGGGC